MKAKTLTQALLLSGVATCFCSSQGWAVTAIEYAKGASGGAHCQQVGGGVLTNFLDSTHTEGTSTGDIRGAVGVEIFGVNGNVYHVQHHWVTDSGDTIYVKDAFLTLIPDRGGKNAQALESLLDCNRFGISPADAACLGTAASGRPAH
jgi:hypothetical protein